MSKEVKFRADIQGLRGVAVLLVVLFHFELLGLKGGFIGVDIFFVISGYLMTLILTSDRFEWSISGVLNFYKGRFWRIAPAYYFVIAATLLLPLLNPWIYDFEQFSEAILASIFFAYNIIAPSQTDYFGVDVFINPFLHLWSLGVEIQFYLIWPIFLFILRNSTRTKKNFVIAAVAIISLIVSEVLLVKDPGVAYYSLPARLWQFSFGALAALNVKRFGSNISWGAELVVLVCLSIFVVGGFWDLSFRWPGAFAVPVTIGTAILLLSGNSTGFFKRILVSSPLCFVGLISYSFYLVHWPVSIFIANNYPESDPSKWLGLMVSFILAVLLYYFVEVPLRGYGGRSFNIKAGAMPIFCLTITLSSLLIISMPGYRQIIIPEKILEYNKSKKKLSLLATFDCKDGRNYGCLLGDISKKPSIVFWGDSHTNHLLVGLEKKYLEEQKSARVIWHSGCGPFLGVDGPETIKRKCQATAKTLLNLLDQDQNIKTVVLSARWAKYVRSNRALFKREFRYVVEQLTAKGKSVVISTQAPEFANSARFRNCEVETIRYGRSSSDNCKFSEIDSLKEQFGIDDELKEVAAAFSNVRILDLKKVFCENENCRAADGDKLYWRDEDHLSPDGSLKVVMGAFAGV